VKAFQEIPDDVRQAGIDFSDEELQAMLGGNALRWLGKEIPRREPAKAR
jgi:hypothetical protein